MFSDVREKPVRRKMTVQRMDAATGKERRPTVDRRMMWRAVGVMMMSEVGDDQACQRREPADSGKMARDGAVYDSHLKVDPFR